MQSESRIGYPGAGSVSSMAAQSMQLQQPQQHNHHTQQQHQQQQQRQHFELQVPRTVFAGQYPQANDNVQLQSDAYYASHSPQHQQIAFQPHEPLTCQTTAQQQQTTTSVYHHLRQRSSQQQQQQQQQLSYSSDPSYLRAQATSQNLARKQHPFHNQDQLTIDHNNNHKHLIQGNSTLTLDCSHENINPNYKQHHITRYVGQKHQDPQEQHQHYQEGSVVVGYNGDYVHSNQQQQTIAGGCSPGAGSPMASSPMASSPDMVISHQQAQEQQFFTNEIADQFSHHQSQMAHQAQAVVFQPTTRALMSHASETNTTTTTMTTTTTTNGHLAQLRPRVNSISTAMRREPTPTTVYSPKLQPVGAITRSLSFSATVGPDQDGQQQLASSSSCMRVRPRPAVSTLDAEVFRRTEQRTQAAVAAGHHQGDDQTQIHLARSGGSSVHYYDAPQSLAPPGSMSSACSSIGSPVPLALSGGSCSDAISPPIGTGHHQARSISSNSSTDGAASIYGQQQQQQLYAGNSYHNQQQQQQQQQQASSGSGSGNSTTTTAGSSCGSSIISTSDSVSMSINLEQYISKRNERERSRVRNVNDAFDNLKNSLPLDVEKMSKRMSKVEILRTAISYIRNLEQVLGYKPQFDDPNSKAPPPSSSSASSLHHHSEHHISYSPTSAAAATANNNKRLNFSRGYRRLDAAHHAYQQQHHHHNRHHHHHHHHNQKHYRSSEERAHGRHYESNGGGSMMARRNGSLSPNEKMITRDDDGEYHAGSGSLTSAGDFDGSRLDEFDGQQLAESDQEQADGSAGTGGDSRGSCMDHHFEGY